MNNERKRYILNRLAGWYKKKGTRRLKFDNRSIELYFYEHLSFEKERFTIPVWNTFIDCFYYPVKRLRTVGWTNTPTDYSVFESEYPFSNEEIIELINELIEYLK